MSFIRSEDALEYVQSLNVGSETQFKFLDKMTHLSKEIRMLLKGMLQFNPYMRLSAKEVLANPYFDDIRIPMNEESAPHKFKFDID